MPKPTGVTADVPYRLVFRLANVRGVPEREIERLYENETREFLLVEGASRRVLPCRNRAAALAELRRVDPEFRPDRCQRIKAAGLSLEEYRSPEGSVWRLQPLDKHHTPLVDWCRAMLEASAQPLVARASRRQLVSLGGRR